MPCKQISAELAEELLENVNIQCIDIRDPQAYQQQHLPKAKNVCIHDLAEFVTNADPKLPTLVYCYKGISSQQAAKLLLERGFAEVYSLRGGFEAWRKFCSN